jgi:hypothetical protein
MSIKRNTAPQRFGARNLKRATDQHPHILKTKSEAHFSARDPNDHPQRRHIANF